MEKKRQNKRKERYNPHPEEKKQKRLTKKLFKFYRNILLKHKFVFLCYTLSALLGLFFTFYSWFSPLNLRLKNKKFSSK